MHLHEASINCSSVIEGYLLIKLSVCISWCHMFPSWLCQYKSTLVYILILWVFVVFICKLRFICLFVCLFVLFCFLILMHFDIFMLTEEQILFPISHLQSVTNTRMEIARTCEMYYQRQASKRAQYFSNLPNCAASCYTLQQIKILNHKHAYMLT